MELTFLVDNNSLVGNYFLAEPGLSMLIEDDGLRVLFDAGYTDAFLINARRMGIDMLHLDRIVLSHGHFDHTWGLDALIRHHFESVSQKMDVTRPELVAHPHAVTSKSGRERAETGMLMSEDKLARHYPLTLTREPVQLTERLVVLGEIERVLDFDQPAPFGDRHDPEGSIKDPLVDDTAMAYVSDQGLIVIAGCAHSGICNTVEQAKRVTGVDNVHTVLGGFHLQDAKPERLDPTTDYLAALELESLYCCHCTDLAAKIALARKCPVKEVGSGLKLSF
ncbi:MBL fold metallo-hydrolase [uncultured Pseudodesulfovibrio sp.]|uniref:MBL fold metallo-hydrolase n=1 Tax=uncultured Pseudodesulfovibrio sp. TaxID=2035858 RepID=UPI0029C7A8A0|nr:MBL fold metallo-hydrolase [uncultured Pseudodesulfovibrio sp.]